MRNYDLAFFFFVLVLAIAIGLACSSPKPILSNCGSAPGTNTTGMLQSITLCPATADAGDYQGGQVQFIAAGYYSTQPSPVAPLKLETWGVCEQGVPTTAVSITSNGLAQCTAGSSGTYSVLASVGTNCNAITACGGGCQVSGYAQLTCP